VVAKPVIEFRVPAREPGGVVAGERLDAGVH
jgi:hypothetical protein